MGFVGHLKRDVRVAINKENSFNEIWNEMDKVNMDYWSMDIRICTKVDENGKICCRQ